MKLSLKQKILFELKRYHYVAEILAENKMDHNIPIEDLEKLVRHVDQQIALRRTNFKDREKTFDFENYHPYNEVCIKFKT